MKVKCIDNEECRKSLTLNEEYEVNSVNDRHYFIINDNGNELGYLKDRFRIIEKESKDNVDLTIEQKVENLENQIKELKEQIHKKQEKDNKKVWWTPKIGDKYWFVGAGGVADYFEHSDKGGDKTLIEYGNYYKTEEEAEREAFERQLRFKLKKFAYKNNVEEINWKNKEQSKYFIQYDYYDNELDFCESCGIKDYGQIYFSSKEVIEKAIETFKDDLTRYFTTNK